MITADEAYELMKKNQSPALVEFDKDALRRFFSFRIKNAAEKGRGSVSIKWSIVPPYDYVTVMEVLFELKQTGRFHIDGATDTINIWWKPAPKVW